MLLCRLNVWRFDKKPKELGTSPEKLLFAKFKISRFGQSIKQLGSCPDNRLSDRSRKPNNPTLILQRGESGPEKRFLERFKKLALVEKGGSGPSKWLALKSNL